MSDTRSIKVAVFVASCGRYGVPSIVLTHYSRAKDYGIDFNYVCIEKDYLYQRLVGLGTDVTVIGGKVPKAYPPNFIKLVFIFLSHLKQDFDIYRKIRSYLKQTQPDLLYTHNITEHILGGLAAKSCGIKTVGHSHVMYNPNRNLGLSRIFVSDGYNCTALYQRIAKRQYCNGILIWYSNNLHRRWGITRNGRGWRDRICGSSQRSSGHCQCGC